jgi:hypothetical protein
MNGSRLLLFLLRAESEESFHNSLSSSSSLSYPPNPYCSLNCFHGGFVESDHKTPKMALPTSQLRWLCCIFIWQRVKESDFFDRPRCQFCSSIFCPTFPLLLILLFVVMILAFHLPYLMRIAFSRNGPVLLGMFNGMISGSVQIWNFVSIFSCNEKVNWCSASQIPLISPQLVF